MTGLPKQDPTLKTVMDEIEGLKRQVRDLERRVAVPMVKPLETDSIVFTYPGPVQTGIESGKYVYRRPYGALIRIEGTCQIAPTSPAYVNIDRRRRGDGSTLYNKVTIETMEISASAVYFNVDDLMLSVEEGDQISMMSTVANGMSDLVLTLYFAETDD